MVLMVTLQKTCASVLEIDCRAASTKSVETHVVFEIVLPEVRVSLHVCDTNNNFTRVFNVSITEHMCVACEIKAAMHDTAHLRLRTKIKIKNIRTGHEFGSKSGPYESSGRADTGKLHRIAVRTLWD